MNSSHPRIGLLLPAGRAVTGIGAAFVMLATLSLLTTSFPPHERRNAIALWAGFAGAGGALGPIEPCRARPRPGARPRRPGPALSI